MTGNPHDADRSRAAAGRPDHLQAGLPALLPQGEHDLRGRPRPHGLRTAWSDKHPAYEILNGPSGTGIQDLFTPEINSDAPARRDERLDDRQRADEQYDSYKVKAVLNEIDGFDHSGTTKVGTPAIFGMNFQTVSTAEKLPTSDGLAGGYLADGVTPGPLLTRALDYVNAQVGSMVAALQAPGPARRRTVDHPLGQARAVARHALGADADPRRPDHRRPQRRLDARHIPAPATSSRSPSTTTGC